jgi:osmotically-inducible protein OsmY
MPTDLSADDRLACLVGHALLGDRAVTGRRIDVSVQNLVVVLDGEVDTETACIAAGLRAWSIPGVVDVCNALHVTGRGSRGQP